MPSAQASAVRLVVDTNVVISGLLWKGRPAQLMALASRDGARVELVSSPVMLEELDDILSRPKFRRQLSAQSLTTERVLTDYARMCELIHAEPLEEAVCIDPDDDMVLATALSGGAHLIVSGDRHLLCLKSFRGIPILTVAESIARLADAGPT